MWLRMAFVFGVSLLWPNNKAQEAYSGSLCKSAHSFEELRVKDEQGVNVIYISVKLLIALEVAE
jgi:hypothetical protein